MAVSLSKGPCYPRHSPSFFDMLPLNDRRRAAHNFFKIDCLFFLSFLSCSALARLRLFILFLLLMIGNVHPNPGSIFPCSVCAGNVTWRGKSVLCCTCSNGSILGAHNFPSHIRSSLQLSLLELSHCRVPQRNTMTPSSGMYSSTVESALPC